MHVFTSVTANYIPKARVLAHSVKKYHEEVFFHLLLSDDNPVWLDLDSEPFDNIINIKDLSIQNMESWIFKHTLVELCTAVKGLGFKEIISKYAPNKIIYLDPDITVMSRLDNILKKLEEASVLLTPHQTEPDSELQAIVDNEICSLKHGIYNLGFLAVRNSAEGRRFVDWWASRLDLFCYDDIPGGLFTDQRWVDLAPAFFDDLKILREPVYNVCTWNLTHRTVTGTVPDNLFVNGQPLCFYHFSGFDSGAQEMMLNVYGKKSPVLRELRDWYIDECVRMGQEEYGKTPCVYDHFSNGVKITKFQRYVYRTRQDLMEAFSDPYNASSDNCYHNWFKSEYGGAHIDATNLNYHQLVLKNNQLEDELRIIRSSKSWKTLKKLGVVNR